MKINHIGPANINPYNRNEHVGNKENLKSNKTDKVEISTAAKEMQQTSKLVTERQEKVAKLKVQIENGTYKVNPEEVAKSIYQFYFNNK